MTEVDSDALRAKYAQERAKRLRPDGNDQYIELKGQFARLLEDPYTTRLERPAKLDDVHWRRLRWPGNRGKTEGRRSRRRSHRGESRRLRRHVVLEPLPRRTVR